MTKNITCADTAKLVRKALKDSFPGQKFSVTSKTYTGGASITVRWTDGPTSAEVDKVIGRFAGADFDSMQDLKTYKSAELNGERVHFGADYIFTERGYSARFLRDITLDMCMQYGHDELPKVRDGGSGAWIDGGEQEYCPGAFRGGYDKTLRWKIFETAGETSLYVKPEPKAAKPSAPDTGESEHDPMWQLFECARGCRRSQVEEYSKDGDVCQFSGCQPDHAVKLVGTTRDRSEAHRWFRPLSPAEAEPSPEPYVPDTFADASARVIQFPARAEFRAPDFEPDPTGTDGGGGQDAEPEAPSSEPAPCPHAETHIEPRPTQTTEGLMQHEQCVACNEFWEIPPRSILPPGPVRGTATLPMLRALKLINDTNVLAERQTPNAWGEVGKVDGRADFARVRLGDVETIINVAKLDKWATTFEPGALFAFEMSESALTLTRGTSFIRFEGRQGIPASMEAIELAVSEAGDITAPALPSSEEMKAARKRLAEGRKALKVERERAKAAGLVSGARADVRRAEEYAAKLEEEAREAIARAEELTEEDCAEAVTLAKRVRDLRRLRRAVEQAAEDPQVNTPEFFEWLTAEHRAAYAEAFGKFEKARERERAYQPKDRWGRAARSARKRFATQTENAQKAVGAVLRRALDEHARPAVREIAAEDCEQYGEGVARTRVFAKCGTNGRRYERGAFQTEPQRVKRALRRLSRDIPAARQSVERAREQCREALDAYAPHVRPDEHEQYVRMVGGFVSPELARAA